MNGLYIDKQGVDFIDEPYYDDFGPRDEKQPSGVCLVVECQNCGRLTTNDHTGICHSCS